MAERKTDVYRLVMEVETTTADPAKWDWETILDLGADERVRIVDSQRIEQKHGTTWRVVTYDLWADGEGGLSVNDKRDSGRIAMDRYDTERDVLRKVCDLVGGDPSKLAFDHNTWADDVIYVLDHESNPACELVREN